MSYHAASGTLLGLVIGDAFGAPFEGTPIHQSKSIKKAEFIPNYSYSTDDTRQALAVAESLVVCRGFDGYDLIKRLIDGYLLQPEFYGPTSRQVFQKVIAGNDPFLSAREVFLENNGGSSNGAVMRGPPVGIMYGVTEVTEYSAICAALTHKNPVTIACSIWVNHMISGLCRGKGKKSAFLHARSSCTEPEVIRVLGSFEQFPIAPLLDALAATHAALLIFMQCSSFEETILRAIYSGGDADTVACISGALAGAFYGLDAVPTIWIEKIHRYQQIISLSQSLWSISHP